MGIVKYVTFDSSKNFEEWQEKEKPKLLSVSPLQIGIDLDIENYQERNNTATAKNEIGVFVTYIACS